MNQPSPHDIVIVIPVADRPRHLTDCFNSLLELGRRYPYAGQVSVLVAEDSRDEASIEQHRALAAAVTGQGLPVHYLGQDEQRALVEALPAAERMQLAGVIGDGASYAHKGASITRNIAYLWLRRLQRDGRRRLFWFIDSDQEFRVNVDEGGDEQEVYAVDYCNGLDRIFRETPTQILTGKVVGDPPVSPAVMAGNFLDDITAFLFDMGRCTPDDACSFHDAVRHADDAAYHDMAELFGFRQAEAFRYRCTLTGMHDHVRCFADFAAKLGRFFDGEHPTRRSVYQAAELMSSVKQARTIYTGNYVFTPAGLDYFIPFAALKLRMAGPTLGRIIKAELGERFVSANLPMLHRRTVEAIGQSEFRPGIERTQQRVDLSGEFERQYFGDVMLFSVERLTAAGYPGVEQTEEFIADIVDSVEAEMHVKYVAQHGLIAEKLARLQVLYSAPEQWWLVESSLNDARAMFGQFLDNMAKNFGDNSFAWQIVNDLKHRQVRKTAIVAAIGRYRSDCETWCALLERPNRRPWPFPLPQGEGQGEGI